MNLSLPDTDYDFAFIGGSSDFHHLLSEREMLRALSCIYSYLTKEGCLTLELEYPAVESWDSPRQRFDLEIPPETGIKAWKYGETFYDAGTMLMHIKQEVYIEKDGKNENFLHEFDFQLISRETVENLMRKAGFRVINEYGDYQFNQWHTESVKWIIETEKVNK